MFNILKVVFIITFVALSGAFIYDMQQNLAAIEPELQANKEPPKVSVNDNSEFYYITDKDLSYLNSILTSLEQTTTINVPSGVAVTLLVKKTNRGICPITGEETFKATVRPAKPLRRAD